MMHLNRICRFGLLLPLLASGLFSGNLAAEDLGTPDWMRNRLSTRISNRRDNGQMMRLVAPLAEKAGAATVQVLSDGKPVALGAIVSTDGYVLTKRSELSADPLRVRLADGRLMQARIAAVRRSVDLALLHIDNVRGLQRVEFSEQEPVIGSFLISAGRGDSPIGFGVMGVRPRRVGHVGRLGVALRNDPQGQALVDGVWPASGADDAGVLPGDRIIAVNGHDEAGQKRVISALRGMYPGEIVRLTIQRDETTVELEAQIRDFSLMQESENDARVNGARSRRLSGFDRVLQHDTVLEPDQCGGPVLNTEGQVVGLNIARAGRVVSYALPGSLVLPQLIEMLKEARGTVPATAN
ncbi:S1C family serine protease [Roseimaritima ulvae]|uniref:Serine endoprotease n=1 Tax=Roseimaritima ulvae TaxID=980254 RepID=A0A5B9QZJ4_9BACT|nr:S1C family serine protease [Roseimaritima ulvae]QEG43389.1 serine endoprotease [Roseimaritima ulvae]